MSKTKMPKAKMLKAPNSYMVTTSSNGLRYKTRTFTNRYTGISKSYLYQNDLSASSVFKVVFGVICLFMFIQVVSGTYTDFSFQGFLRILQNAPNIDLKWIVDVKKAVTISTDWGIFDWLKDFFNNMFGTVLIGSLYIVTGIAQVFSYLIYFVSIAFGMVY